VVVNDQDAFNPPTGCTDNATGGSSTYIAVPSSTSTACGGTSTNCSHSGGPLTAARVNFYYAPNLKPGATAVTCTLQYGYPLSSSGETSPQNPNGDAETWFIELSAPITAIDSVGLLNQQYNASTSSATGASITTTLASDFVVSSLFVTGVVSSVSSPWTVDIDATSGNGIAYYEAASAGTYQPTFGLNATAANYWASSTVGFNGSSVQPNPPTISVFALHP